MFAPNLQPPPQPVPMLKRVCSELGLWAMWAGFITLAFAVVVAFVSPSAPGAWLVTLGSPLLLVDVACIWRQLGRGPNRNLYLALGGLIKIGVVLSSSTILIMGRGQPSDLVPTAFDDLVAPAYVLSGPLTFLAALLRRLGR